MHADWTPRPWTLPLHSASSDLWQNFLGFTRILYWHFLLQLIYKKDDEHRGWMLGGLILLLRTLLTSWLSVTLGKSLRLAFCLISCERVTYLPARFSAERVAQGGPASSHHWSRGGCTTPDHSKTPHLQVPATTWDESHLMYPFPIYSGEGNHPFLYLFYLVINLVAKQGSLSIFT